MAMYPKQKIFYYLLDVAQDNISQMLNAVPDFDDGWKSGENSGIP